MTNRISRKDANWLKEYTITETTTKEERNRIKASYVECILSIEAWCWKTSHAPLFAAAQENRRSFLDDMVAEKANELLETGNSTTLAFEMLIPMMEEFGAGHSTHLCGQTGAQAEEAYNSFMFLYDAWCRALTLMGELAKYESTVTDPRHDTIFVFVDLHGQPKKKEEEPTQKS